MNHLFFKLLNVENKFREIIDRINYEKKLFFIFTVVMFILSLNLLLDDFYSLLIKAGGVLFLWLILFLFVLSIKYIAFKRDYTRGLNDVSEIEEVEPDKSASSFVIEKEKIDSIYKDMQANELISEECELEEFRQAVIFEENISNVKVQFKLTGVDFKYFYNKLSVINSEKVVFKEYIENNTMIVGNKGKPYKYKTLKDYKDSNSDNSEKIDAIFNQFKSPKKGSL